jgi:hypothetical protein
MRLPERWKIIIAINFDILNNRNSSKNWIIETTKNRIIETTKNSEGILRLSQPHNCG